MLDDSIWQYIDNFILYCVPNWKQFYLLFILFVFKGRVTLHRGQILKHRQSFWALADQSLVKVKFTFWLLFSCHFLRFTFIADTLSLCYITPNIYARNAMSDYPKIGLNLYVAYVNKSGITDAKISVRSMPNL